LEIFYNHTEQYSQKLGKNGCIGYPAPFTAKALTGGHVQEIVEAKWERETFENMPIIRWIRLFAG